jgi:probable F420-dependent oxidoreductase
MQYRLVSAFVIRHQETVTVTRDPLRPVRIGVQIKPQHADYAQIRRACAAAEDAGVDVIFNWDHFWPLGRGPRADVRHFECWTMLGALAETTSRVEFGPLVSAIGYRNPDLLADMARTLDHISGGRLVLGVGAGFREKEYAEYAFPFGTPAERAWQLADGLARITRRLAVLSPPPTRRIPILVAGAGEQKTLALVAEYADIWNALLPDAESYQRKSRVLDEHCARIGRDPATIERSVLVAGAPEDLGDEHLPLGASLFIVLMNPTDTLSEVERWITWRDHRNA